MPVYTYRCDNCGSQFERQQSYEETPLKRCPECHKHTLKKVISAVGVVFKGSGFYATDHRSPSGGPSLGKKSDEKKDDHKKDSAKSSPSEE